MGGAPSTLDEEGRKKIPLAAMEETTPTGSAATAVPLGTNNLSPEVHEPTGDDYALKTIDWGKPTRIVLQNENGPCPLIALANALALLGRITLPLSKPALSFEELVQHLSEVLISRDVSVRTRLFPPSHSPSA